MRKLNLLLLLLSTVVFTHAQDFEGKVVFQNGYKSKMANASDEQFDSMMGTTQEYFIKNGNYKSTTNGTFFLWQLYVNKENKVYNKLSSSPAIYWSDAAINPDAVVKAEINKNIIDILGHRCDELVLTCKSGVQKFYFNSKLKIDPKLFEKHKLGNWNEVILRTKSMPLKMIIDSPQFTLVSVATEIVPMKLENKFFQLPAGSKIEKSQF